MSESGGRDDGTRPELAELVVPREDSKPAPEAPSAPLVEGGGEEQESASELIDSVERPAKVMRIGSMTKQLLDEVRQAPLDAASRARMKEIYETSVRELADGLSPDLSEELGRLAFPFETDTPSEAELRVAQAQLVGWLEGLFHGIQATLFAQQMAARSQLEEMRGRQLPPGGPAGEPVTRPGNYL
ncbi:MAG: bacterial proteasome activator family protein [Acidimicrobiales bacterium]